MYFLVKEIFIRQQLSKIKPIMSNKSLWFKYGMFVFIVDIPNENLNYN